MQNNTLKIEIPAGFEIANFDQTTGKITFKEKPKSALERIKTDDDVLADNGLIWAEFRLQTRGLPKDEIAWRFLKLLNKSLNGDWVPDFDKDDYKYEPRFLNGSSGFRFFGYDSWGSCSYVGSRLCYNTYEKAEHAGKLFTKWYKDVIVIK